jgi:hypothetical protein
MRTGKLVWGPVRSKDFCHLPALSFVVASSSRVFLKLWLTSYSFDQQKNEAPALVNECFHIYVYLFDIPSTKNDSPVLVSFLFYIYVYLFDIPSTKDDPPVLVSFLFYIYINRFRNSINKE